MEIAGIKFDEKEIFALIIVIALSLGMWHYPEKQTLPGFADANALLSAVSGSSQSSAPTMIFATAEKAYSALAGLNATSPEAMEGFALFFPSLLLALCTAFLYGALRLFGFRKTISAFAVLLFTFSLASSVFLPGRLSSLQLGATCFSSFLFFLALLLKGADGAARYAIFVLSAFSAALGGYLSPMIGIAGFAAAAAFAISEYQRNEKREMMFIGAVAALALIFACSAALSNEKNPISFDAKNLAASIRGFPFLLAPSACAAILFFHSKTRKKASDDVAHGRDRLEYFLLFLFGLFIASFDVLAGALLMVLPAAEGIARACEEENSAVEKLACAFALASVAVMGATYPLVGFYRAAAIGFFAGAAFPLIIHFYDYHNRKIFAAFALGLLTASVSFSVFAALGQSTIKAEYFDKDAEDAMMYLSKNTSASVLYSLDYSDAASFYLPNARKGDFASLSTYLRDGTGRLDGGYALVSTAFLEDTEQEYFGSSPGFETFAYRSNFTSSGALYAVFGSSSGGMIIRRLSTNGELTLDDGVVVDSYGNAYGTVPISQMVLLRSALPYSDQKNRMIVLDEGTALPHFLSMYSGKDPHVSLAAEFGKVSVFEVK